MKQIMIKQIQELINRNIAEKKTINSSIEKLIVQYDIKKIILENNLYYCEQKELDRKFKENVISILNHLAYEYGIKVKNNRTKIMNLVRKSIIKEIIFYFQDRRQVFIDMDILIGLLNENGISTKERKYLKIKNNFLHYSQNRNRGREFRSVQSFKKWFVNYIPCNIDNISVKKIKDKYLVSSLYLISVPYSIYSIKKSKVDFINIDFEYHTYNKIYEIVGYKEKELKHIDFKKRRLEKALII